MPTLQGRRVLVLEDEYFLADDLADALRCAGAQVVGPTGAAGEAMQLIETETPDLAVLDINLQGELNFAVADELLRRGLPFVFTTGYDQGSIPPRHGHRQLWQKPFDIGELIAQLGQ